MHIQCNYTIFAVELVEMTGIYSDYPHKTSRYSIGIVGDFSALESTFSTAMNLR